MTESNLDIDNTTKWYAQYLPNEDMYYLVEIDEKDGVVGEHFFDEIDGINKYITDNNIKAIYEPSYPMKVDKNNKI
jgi:hypothetical protein